MSLFERIVFAIQREVDTPSLYGPYHLISLFLVILGTLVLCVRLRNAGWGTVRRILSLSLVTMVILELCKQLILAMTVEDGMVEWEYSWFSFPYQFCSTPIYVIPFVIFSPDGRIRNACLAFLSSYSLFAGLGVMLYPGTVFVAHAVIDLQTMVHHGLQVMLGIYLAVHERQRLGRRYFFGAAVVFAITVFVALLLNDVMYHVLTSSGIDQSFNMFFISPHYTCHLPIVVRIREYLSYPVFLAAYVLGFSLVAALTHAAVLGIRCAVKRRSARV